MANQWFRLYSEFATDPKVQSMSEAMQRRLIMLFCIHNSNVLATLQNDEIAFALRLDATELEQTKQLFIKKGFINEGWELLNWDKRQFVSDSSTDRSRKHREKKKLMQQPCNVAATPPDTEQIQNRTDTDKSNSDDKSSLVGKSQEDAPLPTSEKPAKTKKQTLPCPHQDIVALYHEKLPMCPGVREWTNGRAEKLRTRWNESPKRQDLQWWAKFFDYVAQSKFLTGRGPPRGDTPPFLVDLEWLISPTNMAKVIEGKYHRDKT